MFIKKLHEKFDQERERNWSNFRGNQPAIMMMIKSHNIRNIFGKEKNLRKTQSKLMKREIYSEYLFNPINPKQNMLKVFYFNPDDVMFIIGERDYLKKLGQEFGEYYTMDYL